MCESSNHGEAAGNGGPGTILIVDDDVDDAFFTQRAIESAVPKIRVEKVHSGEELICYLQGKNGFSDRTEFPYPVLILLDLKMSGMHGFDVLRWLLKHPEHKYIPVVVLTGSGETVVAQCAYQLGARSFLTKPLNTNEFKETLATIHHACHARDSGYRGWVQ